MTQNADSGGHYEPDRNGVAAAEATVLTVYGRPGSWPHKRIFLREVIDLAIRGYLERVAHNGRSEP